MAYQKPQTRKEAIDALDKHYASQMIVRSICGNEYWLLYNGREGDIRLAVCYFIKDEDGYRYDACDVNMHPYFYNCPKNFVAQARLSGGIDSNFGEKWVKMWEVKWAEKKERRKLNKVQFVQGDRFTFNDKEYIYDGDYWEGKNRVIGICVKTGQKYQFHKKKIEKVEKKPAEVDNTVH